MEEIKILGIRKCCFLLLALLSFTIMADAQSGNADPHERLWQSFLTPPDSIRVGCYYYWVNEQVEPEGVKADLQWMKDNGITLASLPFNILLFEFIVHMFLILMKLLTLGKLISIILSNSILFHCLSNFSLII